MSFVNVTEISLHVNLFSVNLVQNFVANLRFLRFGRKDKVR